MRYLLDTGILLRLVNRADVQYSTVRSAVGAMRVRGDTFSTATQNIAEFWNVCTRPAAARGGLGESVLETFRRVRVVERGIAVLAETAETYETWKRLATAHEVKGVQVHDARLVALMISHGITHVLTLNPSDFSRYSNITAVTPTDVLTPTSPP